LQSLHLVIQRISSKAFPRARNETADLIARDALLDALTDQGVAYKIREMDTINIEQAYKHAVRLSAIRVQKPTELQTITASSTTVKT